MLDPIHFETLTPLFTVNGTLHRDGGRFPRMDRIRETSIIGSLRWWFGALVRGVGGAALPGDNILDQRKFTELAESSAHDLRARLQAAGLKNDVAQVFGATNWRRRFDLRVIDSDAVQDSPDVDASRVPNHRLPSNEMWGRFQLALTPFGSDFDISIIDGLLWFVETRAGLGAKNQLGYGIVAREGEAPDTSPLWQYLQSIAGPHQIAPYPDFRSMFFAEVSADSSDREETFIMKNGLRETMRVNASRRHSVLGGSHHDPRKGREVLKASKVNMSYPFGDRNTIRLWGWGAHPIELDAFRDHLDTKYHNLNWHSLDEAAGETAFDFLNSLLEANHGL